MCCHRAICCRALQIGLQERLLLKPLDLKIELKYAESVEYLLGSFLKAAYSRCCWCGRTDVEGRCHVTNWEIIYRVKKTSEQDTERLGNAHLDGRTSHPQQGAQGKGTVFSESCFGIALMWKIKRRGSYKACRKAWHGIFPKQEWLVFFEVRGTSLRGSSGFPGSELHGFLEHQPELSLQLNTPQG